MKLDRRLAVLLVGTVAASASACTVNDVSDPDASGGSTGTTGGRGSAGESSTGGADSSGAGTAGAVSMAGTGNDLGGAAGDAPTVGTAGSATAGSAGAMSSAGSPSTAGAPTSAGAPTNAGAPGTAGSPSIAGAPASAGAGGAGAGGAGEGGTSVTCDDSTGAEVTCTTACAATFAFPGDACEAVKTTLKPAVAQSVGECIVARTEAQCNDATYTYSCLYEGLAAACPDPAAEAACDTIRETCTTVTQDECVYYANGTTESGLASFTACMVDDAWCLPYSCAEGLSW
jgi:hypothetical protein